MRSFEYSWMGWEIGRKMDDNYSWAYNQFIWTIQDVKKDIERVSKDPIADLNTLIADIKAERDCQPSARFYYDDSYYYNELF